MAYTLSTMLPLGTVAPNFQLPDTISGKTCTFKDVKGEKATVVMFLSNHCPYVHHVNPEIVRLALDYQTKGIGFVAISSNDIENYPDDAPDKMVLVAKKEGYTFPYLFDETQLVAKAYDAACTPDFYLFDHNDKLVYRGQLDDSRPKSGKPATGVDLRNALDALLANEPVSDFQRPSGGCNIKWKATH